MLRALRAEHIKVLQEDVTNASHIPAATYGRVTATTYPQKQIHVRCSLILFLSLSLSLSASKRATVNRTATKYSRKKVTLGNERPESGDGPQCG